MPGVEEGHTSGKKISVYDAADVMGITVDAIRKRIARGTIAHERDEDGRVWVILDTVDKVPDNDQYTGQYIESTTLISEMRARIEFVEEEHRRKDAILLNMTEAMKALSPPQETSPERPPGDSASPGPTRTPTKPREEPQEATQRPWWRRMFGG
jgi:hypothetical protein